MGQLLRIANMSSQQHGATRVSYVICNPDAKENRSPRFKIIKNFRTAKETEQHPKHMGPFQAQSPGAARTCAHRGLAAEAVPKSWGWGVTMSSRKVRAAGRLSGRNPAADLDCKADLGGDGGLELASTEPSLRRQGGSASRVRFSRNGFCRDKNQLGIRDTKRCILRN